MARNKKKLTIYTEAAVGQENELKVWLYRVTSIMTATCPLDRVGVVVVVEQGVDITALPETKVAVEFVTAKEGITGPALYHEAWNQMFSPQSEYAAYMALNVLPVDSLDIFVQPALRNASRFITPPLTEMDVPQVREEMLDEYYRTKVFADVYYNADVVFCDVERASARAARMRCFDFVKRYDLASDAMINKRWDLPNKIISQLDRYNSTDVFRVNPFLNLDATDLSVADIRMRGHKCPGIIAYDRGNSPWAKENADEYIAKQSPYGQYAIAVYQTARHLDPEFIKQVVDKAVAYSEHDPAELDFNLPAHLRTLVDADATAEEYKASIVEELDKHGR